MIIALTNNQSQEKIFVEFNGVKENSVFGILKLLWKNTDNFKRGYNIKMVSSNKVIKAKSTISFKSDDIYKVYDYLTKSVLHKKITYLKLVETTIDKDDLYTRFESNDTGTYTFFNIKNSDDTLAVLGNYFRLSVRLRDLGLDPQIANNFHIYIKLTGYRIYGQELSKKKPKWVEELIEI